jgi:hypothetical protein
MNNITALPQGKYDLQIIEISNLAGERIAATYANINRSEAIAIHRTWESDYSSSHQLVFRTLNRKNGRIIRFAI